MKINYKGFKILEKENGSFLVCFVPGIRNRHKRGSSFDSLEKAKAEVDYRIESLIKEGKRVENNLVVDE